jgi:hypothetical protein
VIVVPVTLFNKSSSGANDACRIILNGDAERAGLVGDELNDARVGCQCALAGAIFDGFSVYPLPSPHNISDVQYPLDLQSSPRHRRLETNKVNIHNIWAVK